MNAPDAPTASRTQSGLLPVPSPIERRIVTVVDEGQTISSEQRERVNRWLTANGLDPKRIALKRITLEYNVRGHRENAHIIGFTEFYVDESGSKVFNEKTHDGAVTYERWVRQTVPLEPDPSWIGWPEYYLQEAQARKERES